MSASDAKFFYFDLRGKFEFVRLLFAAKGCKMEEQLVKRSEWPGNRPAETPYGQVPFMVYKGKVYGQSLAMAGFVARDFGLYGASSEETLRVDEVCQVVEDMRLPRIREWFLQKDEQKKAELAAKLKGEHYPRYLGYFQRLLQDNGDSGYFVGSSLTLADLSVYDILDTVLDLNPDALASYPSLQKLRAAVESVPSIKSYLASRPKYPL